jgi:transcription elongation factor GreB
MVRYRSPSLPKSPYITAQGFRLLKAEQQTLWSRRRKVTLALAAAAAEGDRSENAEYIYRKKELRELDRRIRYLQKRLPEVKVVSQPPSDQSRVYFAAWVSLEKADGSEYRYRIVGPDEIDRETGYISMDSPLAKALMKRGLDDQVPVMTPGGTEIYWITAIEYVTEEN